MDGSGIHMDHERLDAYQLARELARAGNTLVQQVPSGRADLIDQFRRTTLSIPLNIAESTESSPSPARPTPLPVPVNVCVRLPHDRARARAPVHVIPLTR